VSCRELSAEYLFWLEDVKGAKPSTVQDHRCLLADPGQAYRRGPGSSHGLIMAALGDRPAREVTTREVEELLRTIAATGAGPRTVNKARQLVCAIFNYGMRASTYALATNPAQHADRRREPDQSTSTLRDTKAARPTTTPRRRVTRSSSISREARSP